MTTISDEDRALKTKHRGMWASGDYPTVATDLVWELGDVLAATAGVHAGDHVLDVAAGSGNAAIPAARTGARVVASDLTPELFDTGRRLAAEAGVELDWREADAEALPFGDGEFSIVLSCLGVMFAPHHQPAADELVRVCRPGGTIGVLSWTPAGFIGQMFATMKPYAPPPPPGASPPPLWGDPAHVAQLFGDRVEQVSAATRTVRIDHFANGAEFRDYFKANYGPTIAAYRGLADTPERAASLDTELAELGDRYLDGRGGMDWEYLVYIGRRR
ncbi:MAG TPA: class I SAM-dependent methyltransferase [Jatrophihabitans sp.]|nr:class I SAM-dependent methyltransferase [Jatrophihabitans sp.]